MQEKDDTFVSFSRSLAQVIEASGMTKFAFAKAVGVSHASVNNYLTGRLPKMEEALRIARFSGLTLDELITGERSRNPSGEAALWRAKAMAAEQKLEAVKAGLSAVLSKI